MIATVMRILLCSQVRRRDNIEVIICSHPILSSYSCDRWHWYWVVGWYYPGGRHRLHHDAGPPFTWTPCPLCLWVNSVWGPGCRNYIHMLNLHWPVGDISFPVLWALWPCVLALSWWSHFNWWGRPLGVADIWAFIKHLKHNNHSISCPFILFHLCMWYSTREHNSGDWWSAVGCSSRFSSSGVQYIWGGGAASWH